VNGNFANHPLLQIVYIPRMALTFWGDDVSAPKAPISLAECKAVACKEVVKACHRSTNRSGLRATWFYEGFSLKLYRVWHTAAGSTYLPPAHGHSTGMIASISRKQTKLKSCVQASSGILQHKPYLNPGGIAAKRNSAHEHLFLSCHGSDRDLLAATAAKHERAFDFFVRRYCARVHRFLYRLLPDLTQAKHVLECVFLNAYRRPAHYGRTRPCPFPSATRTRRTKRGQE